MNMVENSVQFYVGINMDQFDELFHQEALNALPNDI